MPTYTGYNVYRSAVDEWKRNNWVSDLVENMKRSNYQTMLHPYGHYFKESSYKAPSPKKIIRNGPVTVVFWDDGTKTLVRRNADSPDDPYVAFCAALAKKIYGNNTRVKKLITENTVEQKEKKNKEEKDHD